MEVKKGYKLTEVGVIPEDWEIKKLGELANGVEYGSSAKSNQTGKVPVLRMGNIQNGKIVWDDLVFTDNDNEISKYLLKHNDILFNRTNTIDLVGKTSIYKGERQAIFAGYLIRIKWNSSLINPDFLNYQLNAEYSKKYGQLVLSVAVGQANINGQKLKTYPIPVPPTLTEQRAIATALSDTDALIAALDRLIAKKKAIKQGAMQELLTGRRRLEGFEREWVKIYLKDISDVKTGPFGSSLHESDYVANGTPIITVEHLGEFGITTQNLPLVSDFDLKRLSAYKLTAGDIVFSRVGSVDRSSFISEEESGWLFSGRLLRIRITSQSISPKYLNYHFQQESFKDQVRKVAVGQTMPSLNTQILNNLEVTLPPSLSEQEKIAQILTDMDAEITALERQQDKYKAVKQGMMQELLTGKTRLL